MLDGVKPLEQFAASYEPYIYIQYSNTQAASVIPEFEFHLRPFAVLHRLKNSVMVRSPSVSSCTIAVILLLLY